jgi:hypothetical protein
MTTVTCAQCKAPYAVFGVEPPLDYVCGDCTGNATAKPDRMWEDKSCRPPGPSLFAITTEQWRKQARPQG